MDERALKRAHALESRNPRRRYAAPSYATTSLRRILPPARSTPWWRANRVPFPLAREGRTQRGSEIMEMLTKYAIPLALAAVGIVLLLGLWNMLRGGSPNTSQLLMRWRVVLQFIALCLVMAAIYLAGR